jgi:hypothetical protein
MGNTKQPIMTLEEERFVAFERLFAVDAGRSHAINEIGGG